MKSAAPARQNAPRADQLLRHRHLDDQSADAERRRALRSLSRLAAGADDSGGRFIPVADLDSRTPRSSTFNHIVPRLGATYDLTGDGKTVLKANWGRFYFNPGITLARRGQREHRQPVRRPRVERPQRRPRSSRKAKQATQISAIRRHRGASIDPDLRNSYGDETSFFIERALLTDLGVRAGFVYKNDSDGWQQVNAARPFEHLQHPRHRRRSGPGRRLRQRRRRATSPAFNLTTRRAAVEPRDPQHRRLREHDFKTLEFSVNKRYSNRWSMNASYSHTWTRPVRQHSTSTTASAPRSANFSLFGSYPSNPNEKTVNEYTDWNAKVSGHVRRRLGPARDAGGEDAERRAVWPLLRRPTLNFNYGAARSSPSRSARGGRTR